MPRAKKPRGKTSSRGYGSAHQRARRSWAKVVAAGQAHCTRCGGLILPSMKWHLDHDDTDRRRYRGVSHERCNVAASNMRRRSDPTPATTTPVNLDDYQDDPERGIF